MSFDQEEVLNNHLHAIKHRTEKPFSCEVCFMQFSSSDELSEHSAVHSGSNLFSCAYCGRSFPSAMSQIDHLYTCEAVDRVSDCSSDSEMVPSEDSIEQQQTEEETVSCKACHANLSKADFENHVCEGEQSLQTSDSCSGVLLSNDDSNEQYENILCAICEATLSEADIISHNCTNDPTKKLFMIGGEVYQIESVKTEEMLVNENDSEEYPKPGNQILTCNKYDREDEVASSSKTVDKCSLQSKTHDFPPAGNSDDHEHEMPNFDEYSQSSNAFSKGKNCDEILSEDSSFLSHEDAVDCNLSDNKGGNKDSVSNDSFEIINEETLNVSAKGTLKSDNTKDSDTIALKAYLAKQYNKGSTKRSFSKINKNIEGQLSDYSNKASVADNDNQIIEVIIVEPKPSNAYHESGIEDDYSTFSERADIESNPENHSDSIDLDELRVETCLNSSKNSHLGPNTFPCPQCPMVFTLKHNLTMHLRDVHFEDIFVCKLCKMSFSTKQFLQEHHQKAHECFDSDSMDWNEELNDDCDSSCEFDEEIVKQPKSKKENKQTFSCNFCSKQFSHLNSLKSHMSFFHLNEDDSGVCPKCDQVIDSGKPHKCPTECKICGKRFKAFYLKQHMNSHLGLKPFTCPECPLVFSHKHNLTRHLKNIHAEGNLQCRHCEMFFSTKQMLKDHCQQAHASKAAYQCEECGMGPMKYPRYLKHKKIFHNSPDQTFPCPFCEKICLDGITFKEHLLSHESKKSYECLDCPKTFTVQKSFTRHAKHHAAAKAFKCSQCDKSFHSNSHLQAHVRIHTGEKPFKCQECGKAFTQMGSLSHHVRVHMGKTPCPTDECLKPFPHKCSAKHRVSRKSFDCTLCEKSFYSCSQLKNHMRVHTGEKPHKCQECGKSFAQQGTLLYHMRSHAGEKPYTCSECQKSFIHRGGLNSHKCRKARSS